jgi:site-specific recombinase XerD
MGHMSAHSYRHTFASDYLTMGGTIESLSKLLGHIDIKTTQIYADVTDIRIENELDNLKLSNIR